MRSPIALAVIGLALTGGLAVPAPAEAGWIFRDDGTRWFSPAKRYGWWERDQGPGAPNRYPYIYDPPGYYPYYNSGYWRPAREMRRPRPYYIPPAYYPAWGYTIETCGEGCDRRGGPLK